VQPHDDVCTVIQQLVSAKENDIDDKTSEKNDNHCEENEASASSFVETIVVDSSRSSNDNSNNRLLDHVHILCNKMEFCCKACQSTSQCSSMKKSITTQQSTPNHTISFDPTTGGGDRGSCNNNNSINCGISDKADSSDSDDERLSCSICLERFVVGDKVSWSPNPNCCHVYHHACIRDWLLRRTACPYCRETVLPVDKVLQESAARVSETTANNSMDENSTTNTSLATTTTTTMTMANAEATSTTLPPQVSDRKENHKTLYSNHHNNLSMERIHRFRSTFFCVSCGLVCIAPKEDGCRAQATNATLHDGDQVR
jgi:hypothetical protein